MAIMHRIGEKRSGYGARRFRESGDEVAASDTLFGELGDVCEMLQGAGIST